MNKHWEIFVALIAVAAGLWNHVKSVGVWLRGFVIKRVFLCNETVELVTAYLGHVGRAAPREPYYGVGDYFVRPLARERLIAWQQMLAPGMFWYRRRPLWIEKVKEAPIAHTYDYACSFVRGTMNWEKLLLAAVEWRCSMGGGESAGRVVTKVIRHKVTYHYGRTLGSEIARQRDEEDSSTPQTETHAYSWNGAGSRRLLGWKPEDIGSLSHGGSFDTLALSPALKSILRELRFWFESKAWYLAHYVVWRRGYLLHGLPGTGKTSWARAVAQELDLPVHVIDLASMSNEDLRKAWSKANADAPCMILVEDIDAVFDGRTNVSPGGGMMSSGGLTYDALLNCIDGIERVDGVLTVMTTNNLDKVDAALVDRPGRIDRVVEFLPLDLEGRVQVAKQILGEEDVAWCEESGDIPAAQFVERCCRAALAKHFAKHAPKVEPYR